MNRMKLLFTLAIPVLLSHETQAQTSSRLVGEAHYSNNGAIFTPVDTSYFSYSNGRGGDLTHILKYDNATTLLNASDSAFINEYNYLQTFDGNNNLLTTIVQYWEGSSWINSTKTNYFYDTTNKLTSTIFQEWGGSSWINVTQDIYTYNSSGQLFSDVYQTWDGAIFVSASEKTYYYDASGNKIQEQDAVFGTSGTVTYSKEYTYSYSGSNQLLTTTYSTYNGSSFVPATEYINTYDSSGDMINQLFQTYNATTSAFVPDTLRSYSNFSGGLPTTEADQLWDTTGSGTYNNTMQYTYTYNSFNQLTSATGESWTNTGSGTGFYEYATGDPLAYYYYQTYTPSATAAVKNVVVNGGTANIYPIPAQNILHIDLTWNLAQSATIAVYDMQGRVINQWTAPSGTQYSTTVSLSNLADGMYVVKISGTQGQIVKQIVVAH